jgi:Ca-activated chloride channel family protein
MTFASPYLLLLLAVVPAVALVAWWLQRRRARYAVAFTNLDVLAGVIQRRRNWRALVPLALFLLALTAATAAVARPQATVRQAADRATVVLLVDVSGSMQANDVKPTRLLAAARAMSLFASKVPDAVRVGLISFSSGPNVLVPPTTDRSLLQEGIDLLEPEGGTAIGDGLGVAVQVVKSTVGADVKRSKDGKIPGAIILLSDGAQTRGTLTPLQGADRAKKAGIRVFTVALGTNHGTLGPGVLGGGAFQGPFFGGSGRFVVRPDPVTLAAIAKETDGETFRAKSADKVESIYKKLGTSIATRATHREVTSWFAGAAAVLLLASLGAARATGGRLP